VPTEPFTQEQIDLLTTVAAAAAEKAIQQTSFVHLQPGEVTAVRRKADGTQVADVHMDGDETGTSIPASVVGVSEPVAAGDRVMTIYSPPHAHHIFGVTRPSNGASTPACWQSGAGASVSTNEDASYHVQVPIGLTS